MLIGYFADGPWSHKAFERLIKKPNLEFSFICGRFDQNDKVLKDYASKHKIPFMTSENINGSEFLGIPEVDECDILMMTFPQNQQFRTILLDKDHRLLSRRLCVFWAEFYPFDDILAF